MGTKKSDISQFLKDFKLVVTVGRGLDVIPRDVNQRALIELGLGEQNRREIILALSAVDYCSGPSRDKDKSGYVWVFGKRIFGKEIYIKLKIAQVNGKTIAKCLSFHEAERPLTYPLKDS